MLVASLSVQASVQLMIGASFALVGRSVHGRATSSREGTIALRAFLAWWYGLAAYISLLGLDSVLGATGLATYDLFLALGVVKIPFLVGSLWGMMTYVAYMWTGRIGVWKPAAAYAAALGIAHVLSLSLNTDGLVLEEFNASLHPVDATLMTLLYSAFALPLLACIVAYGAVARRVEGAEQKYRVRMVATSLFLWILSALAGAASGNAVFGFFSVFALGLATSIVLLLAYRPPRRLRKWFEKQDALGHGRSRGRDLPPAF